MKLQDVEAARQLASEMSYVEGAKFLRSELGWGLREAIQVCEQIAREFPTSRLAASLAARDASNLSIRPSPIVREA
ncbi:hypothetical protein HNR00_003612 [Methylorubrum rhodinum]|uniref:Uncharacterized protein n=1 Tax=Methylorubrum rhodinum TaxID=29428 RepID=A0A840ZPC1_9HYPH|nr:hypothetical protein [Methylorubrum rhodinum]MBB5758885.1 hypothetical protein [Methylorubrum rhodinum]